MTTQAVSALQHESRALVEIAETWEADVWAAPSRCDGWSNKDVICHLAALFQQLCDPQGVPTNPALGEASADLAVEARRHHRPRQVLDDYISWGSQAFPVLAVMQDDMAAQVVTMGSLGDYECHLLANAYAFDHHCHVRHDLRLATATRWPADTDPNDLTEAAADWMTAAAPQMCGPSWAALTGAVTLELGERRWVIESSSTSQHRGAVSVTRASDSDVMEAVAAVITSTTDDFILWGSKRLPWRDMDVTINGDHDVAQTILDHFKVF